MIVYTYSNLCKFIKSSAGYEVAHKIREVTLKEFGIEIIRFTNDEIINDIDSVIAQIRPK